MLVQDLHIRVINAATGELLRDLTLDPTRDYQPTGRPPGHNQKHPGPNEGSGVLDLLRDQRVELRVELRGFEPLTPSMRTQCSTGQTGQVTVSAQVSGLRTATLTASGAA